MPRTRRGGVSSVSKTPSSVHAHLAESFRPKACKDDHVVERDAGHRASRISVDARRASVDARRARQAMRRHHNAQNDTCTFPINLTAALTLSSRALCCRGGQYALCTPPEEPAFLGAFRNDGSSTALAGASP
eukprot:scaffold4600_cov74-Phaeocystis_antarctica.AAC.4